MTRARRILIWFCLVFWTAGVGFGQECEKTYTLLVKPFTELPPNLPTGDWISEKMRAFNFAKQMHYSLAREQARGGCIYLKSAFNEVESMMESLRNLKAKEFVDSAVKILKYSPDVFLFASLGRETGVVVLRAEVLDLSATSRLVVERRIDDKDFVSDVVVNTNVNELAEEIIDEFSPCHGSGGLLSPECYIRSLGDFNIGLGMGLSYTSGIGITLGDISKDLRYTPPHPEDVALRGDDILSTSDQNNYIVKENSTEIDLGHRIGLDFVQFTLWGIFNISIRTTLIEEPDLSLGHNLYRKWYVTNNVNNPDDPSSGTAYIYYSIGAKRRSFFESKSFSLPLTITYPFFYIGKKKDAILRILLGTNILLPGKVELESTKGWYRYSEYEPQEGGKVSIGDLKEVEWLIGLDVQVAVSQTMKAGFQIAECVSEWKGDFSVPISFSQRESATTLFKISFMRMF
jgi:hypothetical protein